MTMNDMMAEIRDANLSYLMLAQQMIRADKVTAIFRLGVSAEIADLIEGMSNAQILKLAGGNMMLARFRFDDTAILGMLTSHTKERSLAQSHAAILMAGQRIEAGTALAWGLLDRIVPPEALMETAETLAADVLGAGPGHVAAIKRMIAGG